MGDLCSALAALGLRNEAAPNVGLAACQAGQAYRLVRWPAGLWTERPLPIEM